MQNNNLKNIVVLKNLESNLIEEAIIILRDNKRTNEEKREILNIKSKYPQNDKGINDKKFVIEQAEQVIDQYASKEEIKEETSKNRLIKNMDTNVTRKLKNNLRVAMLVLIIQTIALIIK